MALGNRSLTHLDCGVNGDLGSRNWVLNLELYSSLLLRSGWLGQSPVTCVSHPFYKMGMIIPYWQASRILWDIVHIVKSYNYYYCCSSPLPWFQVGHLNVFSSVSWNFVPYTTYLSCTFILSCKGNQVSSWRRSLKTLCARANSSTRGDWQLSSVKVKLLTIANVRQAGSSSSLPPSLGLWKLVLISQQIPIAQNPVQHCPRQLLPVVGSDIQVEIYWHPI